MLPGGGARRCFSAVTGLPTIAIVFAQFAAYHIDRVEAAAQHFAGRAHVVGIEVATGSRAYAWEKSGDLHYAEKRVLFEDAQYEAVSLIRRFGALRRASKDADTIFVGLPYSDPAALALMWWGRVWGKRIIVMSESKEDDFQRRPSRERMKRGLLRSAHGALVGGPRQIAYARQLGFEARPVLPGYDGVGGARIRRQAGSPKIAWQERSFVYVGRFVKKKNLRRLLEAYALYVRKAGSPSRRLVMVGDGPLRPELEELAVGLGIVQQVEWAGFLSAAKVSEMVATSLALCLVSTREQWGLVVNEAAALSIPVIASSPVGATDLLVEDGRSGFVVGPDDVEGIADAMVKLSRDHAAWSRFCERSRQLADRGDVAHFAAGVAVLAGLGTAADETKLGELLDHRP